MELDYTYFEADEGGFIGYFTDFPQHVTEGETIEELEEMLTDMFECLNLAKYQKRKLAIAQHEKNQTASNTQSDGGSIRPSWKEA